MAETSIYTIGGTVQAGGGIYISRQADEELLNLCQTATFAYVLTPRQMGKSSLMVRTAETLTQEGITSIIVDLQELGVQVTAEQWYLGFLVKLDDQLMLDTDVVSWWREHEHLGVSQRLTLFFEKVLLAEVEEQVVIFVDEIDSTLSLNFTDDFYTAIRYLYVARATNPEFQRLSLVLMGVATPGDLIRDPRRTPFNIAQRLDLMDFTFEEALPLADGLGLPTKEAQQVLRWALKWTGGHPYLTQRLCRAITEKGKKSWSQVDIEHVVSSTFFGAMSKQDNNLQFVRDMLTKRSPDIFRVLFTYGEIRRGKRIIFDKEQSLIQSHLKLSGVVCSENARLRVRNMIYKKVFDERWLKENLPITLKVLTFQTVLLVSVVVTLLILGMRQLGVLQAGELIAYDQMLPIRPSEPIDDRIVIVGINEKDIEWLNQYPVTDEKIAELLANLETYKPLAIGLDIFKNIPVKPGGEQLAQVLRSNSNIIGIEKILPPAETSPPQSLPPERIGFVDLLKDKDSRNRRYLLYTPNPNNINEDKYSLALQLAAKYLNTKGIELETGKNDPNTIRIRDIELPRITHNFGGYVGVDDGGVQVLLNFRTGKHPFRILSLRDITNGNFQPSWLRDRIVLVGLTALSFNDVYTSNSIISSVKSTQPGQVYGVEIHAHAVSQIVSAVLDERPLIWYWPKWGEFLLIWSWSFFGGVLAWRCKSFLRLALAVALTSGVLYLLCFGLLIWGAWVPFFPSVLALIITSGSIVTSRNTLQKQKRIEISQLPLDRLETVCKLNGEEMTDVVVRLITEYIEQNEFPNSINAQGSQKHKN
ncbi:MAG: CHASE2 domain-containing protein [Nostoc sp. DedQUE04]|uniref:CHASE2 domain-containing protein n=1 Tax=Nostoc sp. DedQUE04 TaxID=3075390 RepID=UPI002AD38240|nr:CHASE2 domain-containing protein [Nostoc sp. DedQUE04]MDZ8140474.1 CHASE2 domain-containing protein [Nostoc sp. DedQUE04]